MDRPGGDQTPVKDKDQQDKQKSNNGSIQVYCRFRPIGGDDRLARELIIDEDRLAVLIKIRTDKIDNGNFDRTFKFTKVFDQDSTQKEIFSECVLPTIKHLFYEGKNALIFTYGVTNAGKSYTIVGDDANPGVLPNTMKFLLKMKEHFQTKERLTLKENATIASQVYHETNFDRNCIFFKN